MNMKTMDKLCDGGTWKGPMSEAMVAAYENVLGTTFPADYRNFLRSFGSGHKQGIEIAGIDPIPGSDFNVIGRTILQRRGYRYFPQDGIFFSDTGDGGQIYFDRTTGEVREIFAEPPSSVSEKKVAQSFGDFLRLRFE